MSTTASATKRPAGAVIYEELRESIVKLELAPGSFVYETTLAERYGTSRTPVRQALAQLAQDQLLEILPQRGARVAPLSVKTITEAQAVRESLEITAIRSLATAWDADDLAFRLIADDIEVNLSQQDRAAEDHDYAAFVVLDSAFHSLLLGAAGNEMLQRTVETVRLHLQRMRYLELAFMHHEMRAIEQHREIRDAVLANRADEAGELMMAHLALLADVRDEIISRRAELFTEE